MFKRVSVGDRTFQVLNYFLLGLLSLMILLPIVAVVMNSFVSEAEISRRGVFIIVPQQWDSAAYQMLWTSRTNIFRAYGNTLWRVLVGTSLNLVFTIALAYPLAKRDLKGRGLINAFVFFTMIFGGGLVPRYMVVKWTGLLDSLWALIVPGIVSTWNMFMMRNFFYSIPESLTESAKLDGASEMQVLTRIVLPCSLASIATIGLFYAVGHWNAWFDAMIYTPGDSMMVLQMVLRRLLIDPPDATMMTVISVADSTTETVKMASVVVALVPIMCAYPFVQKYFTKGVMLGAVKG